MTLEILPRLFWSFSPILVSAFNQTQDRPKDRFYVALEASAKLMLLWHRPSAFDLLLGCRLDTQSYDLPHD